jgi:glycosyltransferase involved in cell wall biosynthesis
VNLVINHVTSNTVYSRIFEDIFAYFARYSGIEARHIVSEKPIPGADIRHYHRPHLEEKLISPCVVTVHHDLNDPDSWLSLSSFTERYKEADRVICLNSLQQQTLAGCGIDHTCVIPHGFNHHLIEPAREAGPLPIDKFTLALVSKRYDRKFKGEAYLIELAKRLDPDLIRFFLAGDGRSEEGKMLRALGFEVEVYERLPYPALIDAYRGVSALLMISNFEGGPANIPEAAAMGVPLFANPIGMIPDLIIDGRHGIYLSMNPDTDAQRIDALAKPGNEEYLALRDNCAQPNARIITWEASVAQNIKQYLDVIKERQAAISQLMESYA